MTNEIQRRQTLTGVFGVLDVIGGSRWKGIRRILVEVQPRQLWRSGDKNGGYGFRVCGRLPRQDGIRLFGGFMADIGLPGLLR